MLTVRAPDPAQFELGTESSKYKAALVAYKARKADEREHPEKYGEHAKAPIIATNTDVQTLRGQLAEMQRRFTELEAKTHK